MSDDDDVPRDTSPTPSTDTRRTVDLSEWLTLAEAAKALGVSTRTIERWAKAGKLESRLRPQAHGPHVAVYYPGDVADRATERQRAPAPFVLPVGPAGNGNQTHASGSNQLQTRLPASDDDPIRQLFAAALRAVLSPTPPTVSEHLSETLYVTVKEAAAILGLPQADVRRLCHDGDLNHRLTGRGGIRIRRKDLEQL